MPSRKPTDDDLLVTHRAVVATLPAGIRRDFETDDDRWRDRLAGIEAGELWRLPPVPPTIHVIEQWGRGPIGVRVD